MDNRKMPDVLIQAAVIVLAGLWIYAPTYQGEWLWKDEVFITQIRGILSGSLPGLATMWSNPVDADHGPLTRTALWLQTIFCGTQTTGYHVTTILLHITSGLLLWVLLSRMRIPGAWGAALLFTIHPVGVESVAWVSATTNTLSTALFLASCIFWVDQDDQVPGTRREWLYLLSLAFFLLAMFASPLVMTMPLLTPLHAWWKRGTVTMQDVFRAAPLFLIAFVLGIFTIQYPWNRAVGSEAVPAGGVGSQIVAAGTAVVATVAIWLEKRGDRERTVLSGMAAGMMLFWDANSFVYANAQHLCEHTLAGNDQALLAHDRFGIIKLRSGDVEAAYRHCQRVTQLRPDLGETWNHLPVVPLKDPTTRMILANLRLQQGLFQEARGHYEKILLDRPDNPAIQNQFALALFKLGETARAIEEFHRVFEVDPTHREAAENLKMAISLRDGVPKIERKQGPEASK